MASKVLKHRVTADPDTGDRSGVTNDKRRRGGREKRRVMAKRGLRSLAVAVSVPLSLTVLSACIGYSYSSTSSDVYKMEIWFPPWWALHFTCPACSFLMGLSAWMVWADGGFHTNPMPLLFYFTQFLFTVLWDPLVFAAGATRLGFIVSVGLFISQLACMRAFRPINPIAAHFIKPSLASVAFLSVVNLKLLFI